MSLIIEPNFQSIICRHWEYTLPRWTAARCWQQIPRVTIGRAITTLLAIPPPGQQSTPKTVLGCLAGLSLPSEREGLNSSESIQRKGGYREERIPACQV
jgi:hypothetical protein